MRTESPAGLEEYPTPVDYPQVSENQSIFGQLPLTTNARSSTPQILTETLDSDGTHSPPEMLADEEQLTVSPYMVNTVNTLCEGGLRRADSLFRPIGSIMVVETLSRFDLVLTSSGPGAWMSICSKPGIRWVTARTGFSFFAESAQAVTMRWTQRLKLERPLHRERAAEPTTDLAWKYCKCQLPSRSL